MKPCIFTDNLEIYYIKNIIDLQTSNLADENLN